MAKRKTPPALARVIMDRQPEVIAHLEEMLRVKRTVAVENQASHVSGRTEEEMVAFVNGFNACLEVVMHEFNCYAGFHWYGPEKDAEPIDLSIPDRQRVKTRTQVRGIDPDYLEWRKLYYTNGIAKA